MGFFAEFNVWLTALLNDYIHQYTAKLAVILEPALVTLGDVVRPDLGLPSHCRAH